MNKEEFLLIDRIKEIKSSFIKDGWVTVYQNNHTDDNDNLIFCCLVDSKRIKTYRLNTDWVIGPTMEGKPAIISTYRNGKEKVTYQTLSDKGIEPFIFSKHFNFSDGHESYIDISEEFVLYFQLYEKGQNKQNRKFYFIDDVGELDEVIIIQPTEIKVKLKYLKEYISIRKMYFAICFDFMCKANSNSLELNLKSMDEIFQNDYYYYSHLIRPFELGDKSNVQSWIHGKTIIDYDKKKTKGYHFDYENKKYEKFIVGYDSDGDYILEDCRKTNEKYFILTYIKKEVLNKYYNEPSKYQVDGWSVSSNFFSLKIDNNIEDYIAIFLIELSSLPHKEQLHWKQYNIPPQKGISNTYFKTMIEGSWAEHPETPDLFFKHIYKQFNAKWEKKFGWKFYKPLSKQNEHYFTSLHLPTTNNIKSFCEQILSLVIITIDSINEVKISKGIILEKNDKGITKLEKFLHANEIDIPAMLEFLRHLQNIRSGLIAHRFSESNKKTEKAIEYFGLNNRDLMDVAKDIFTKSIYTINTLERRFELNNINA